MREMNSRSLIAAPAADIRWGATSYVRIAALPAAGSGTHRMSEMNRPDSIVHSNQSPAMSDSLPMVA